MTDTTWTVAGLDLDPDDVTLSPSTISLAGRISRRELSDWRDTVGERAGDYREIGQTGGQVRVDTTDGKGTLTVEPPATFQPPEPASFKAVVDGFSVETPAPDARRVSVSLRRTSLPDSGSTLDEAGGDAALDLGGPTHAVIALPTEAVGALQQQAGAAGNGLSLSLRLTGEEAAALRQAGLVRGVSSRQVPDGAGRQWDATDGHQLAGLALPLGSKGGGLHLLQSWSLSRPTFGERPWRAQLTLLPDRPAGYYVGINQDRRLDTAKVDGCVQVRGSLATAGSVSVQE